MALLAVGGGGAAHAATNPWSTAGGDPGRAGFQLLGMGSAPYQPLWWTTGGTNRIVTSILVTAPGTGSVNPRVVFGTRDGRLHLHDLYSGRPIGDPAGVVVGAQQPSSALTGFGGSVTPADSSTPAALGQLFAVVNDRVGGAQAPGVAIVQVDELSGRVVQLVRVPYTEGLMVSSSPLLTPAAGDGSRALVFTAIDRADWQAPANGAEPRGRVFRVPVRDPLRTSAELQTGAIEVVEAPDLNPLAAPTFLRGAAGSGPAGFVTVPGRDPDHPLPTLVADDFGDTHPDLPSLTRPRFGPSAPRLDSAATAGDPAIAQTAIVPAEGARALLVATYTRSRDETVLHRLVPSTDGTTLVEAARSIPLPGRPGPQPATSERGGDQGTVVVGTARNLYGLDGVTLVRRWSLAGGAGLASGRGFTAAAPVLSSDTVFVTTDDGRRMALALEDGVALGEDRFDLTTAADHPTAAAAAGAVAHGVVVLASDAGVIALRNRCGNPLTAIPGVGFVGTEAGDRAHGGRGNDAATGHGGDDCLNGGLGNDNVRGGAGDDVLAGAEGRDLLLGNDGNDTLRGGPGDDRLSGAAGADALDGGTGDDTLRGGAGVDALAGAAGDDELSGDGGIDTLTGGAGADHLIGGTGDDRLEGGSGADVLSGGSGRDVLLGGTGAGRLFGGNGDDRLDSANHARDVVDCGAGRDRVTADPEDVLKGCEQVTRRGRR
jgi:Ca2+-binding RTX toxin-like protein